MLCLRESALGGVLFWIVCISTIVAKIVYLLACFTLHSYHGYLLWSPTFFFEDILVIVVTRFFMSAINNTPILLLQLAWSLVHLLLASATIACYLLTGAIIRWQLVGSFHFDAAAIHTLAYAAPLILCACVIISGLAWIISARRWRSAAKLNFARVLNPFIGYRKEEQTGASGSETAQLGNRPSLVKLGTCFSILALFLLRCARPSEAAYESLSYSIIFQPFIGNPSLEKDRSLVDLGDLTSKSRWFSNQTSLHDLLSPGTHVQDDPARLEVSASFNETGQLKRPYDVGAEAIHISNNHRDVEQAFKDRLASGDVVIKHVIVVVLESTRQDAFPIRENSVLLDRIAKTYNQGKIPRSIRNKLAEIGSTAAFLTGRGTLLDESNLVEGRGGISATDAVTSGTYTLKSLAGTLCGHSPLVADFNREYQYTIPQLCLPHIFNELNQRNRTDTTRDDFRLWPWHSLWMQSVTDNYDHQHELTDALGFEQAITKESMEDPAAKFYPPQSDPINYYGYVDTELRPYLRNAIEDAERQQNRLFLTHLTGTTHHPWNTPKKEYQKFLGSGGTKDLEKYLNAIGFADSWLKEVLSIMDDTGIANNTLLVVLGDHGISLPVDGSVTPYGNPNFGNFQIPLLFSHPLLPQLTTTSRVTSLGVLPTILDLLVESSSLDVDDSEKVKKSLLNYEGQSMIRPIVDENEGNPDWQFTVMNTGGTWVAVRSSTKSYRLIVPLVADMEWIFSDVKLDPEEQNRTVALHVADLTQAVAKGHGQEAAGWVIDAAYVSRWWVTENHRRWNYTAA